MLEPAMRPFAGNVEAAPDTRHQDPGDGLRSGPGRRYTADTFRALAARLRSAPSRAVGPPDRAATISLPDLLPAKKTIQPGELSQTEQAEAPLEPSRADSVGTAVALEAAEFSPHLPFEPALAGLRPTVWEDQAGDSRPEESATAASDDDKPEDESATPAAEPETADRAGLATAQPPSPAPIGSPTASEAEQPAPGQFDDLREFSRPFPAPEAAISGADVWAEEPVGRPTAADPATTAIAPEPPSLHIGPTEDNGERPPGQAVAPAEERDPAGEPPGVSQTGPPPTAGQADGDATAVDRLEISDEQDPGIESTDAAAADRAPEPFDAPPGADEAAEAMSEESGATAETSAAVPPLPQPHVSVPAAPPADHGVEPPLTGDGPASKDPQPVPVALDADTAAPEEWHESAEPDPQSGETARMLLDIMSMPSGAAQPQERALAGDTLLRLINRMPLGSLIALCERLCIMETPPPLLLRRLIRHGKMAVAGLLLERCAAISDQDLLDLIETASTNKLRLIARRRRLSSALVEALIRCGDGSVLLTLVRNPGAGLSHEAFMSLAESARSQPALQAPLATRADTPAPIAFELFWFLPPELRRYVLTRFLTDSGTLDRILKIAHSVDSTAANGERPSRPPERRAVEELTAALTHGDTTEAARRLSALAGICEANALRIACDPDGEPLTVALKAIGLSRTRFAAAVEKLQSSPAAPLRADRNPAELKSLFDSLSFTKARVLLTYWDWAVNQSGPYASKAV